MNTNENESVFPHEPRRTLEAEEYFSMFGLRRHDIYWFIGVYAALVVTIALLATVMGWGYGVEVSDNPAGGHVVTHGIIKERNLSLHWIIGVRPEEYHHTLFTPPPILGFDIYDRPPDHGYPADWRFRIANWFAAIPFAICAWWCRKKYCQPQQRLD